MGVRCTRSRSSPSASSRSRRRSENGWPVRSRSSRASRSKATKLAGVFSASIRTRDSAGWSRCWRASKSRPPSVTTTTSPSTTHRGGSARCSSSTSSGKYRVRGRSLRDPSSISSPSWNTMQRNPSHLGSNSSPATWGTSCTALASIGFTGGITGRSTGSTVLMALAGGALGDAAQPPGGAAPVVTAGWAKPRAPQRGALGDAAQPPGEAARVVTAGWAKPAPEALSVTLRQPPRPRRGALSVTLRSRQAKQLVW